MRAAVVILTSRWLQCWRVVASRRQAHKDRRVTPALKEMPARKDWLGPPGREVCKALQEQREPHHSSALSARPARILPNARRPVVMMRS